MSIHIYTYSSKHCDWHESYVYVYICIHVFIINIYTYICTEIWLLCELCIHTHQNLAPGTNSAGDVGVWKGESVTECKGTEVHTRYHICIYMYMYVYICIYICICVYVCIYMYIYVCISSWTHRNWREFYRRKKCVAVCSSELQCVAVCCSMNSTDARKWGGKRVRVGESEKIGECAHTQQHMWTRVHTRTHTHAYTPPLPSHTWTHFTITHTHT